MSTEGRGALAATMVALVFCLSALIGLAWRARASEDVIVWAPQGRLAAMLSMAPVSLVDAGRAGFVVLRGDAPGFVATLYAQGAWVVLPARRGSGCVSVRGLS